jgi:hypothetical protein
MWNMLISMIVFGHSRFADIIREMNRNIQLRYICGFVNGKLPGNYNVSRFIQTIEEHQLSLLKIFIALSEELYNLLPDFGESLAIDSKWTWSLANKLSKQKNPDRRSETDATWGKKEYSGTHDDGSEWKSVKRCFGFKVHLIVDTKYELPIAFSITDAAGSDIIYGKELLKQLAKDRPGVIEKCLLLAADKGYDDTPLIQYLKEKGIKSLIDKRNQWRVEAEKMLPGYEGRYYNERGEVYCYSKEWGERHRMISAGYDKERDALRFRCPVNHYGCECRESADCPYCKNIRVPLATDERIFTQIDRTSYRWKNLYAGRTAVERVNSRLDVSFGFEQRRIRGKTRMELLCALSFAIMNAVAVGRIKEKKPELMRSLVRAA